MARLIPGTPCDGSRDGSAAGGSPGRGDASSVEALRIRSRQWEVPRAGEDLQEAYGGRSRLPETRRRSVRPARRKRRRGPPGGRQPLVPTPFWSRPSPAWKFVRTFIEITSPHGRRHDAPDSEE